MHLFLISFVAILRFKVNVTEMAACFGILKTKLVCCSSTSNCEAFPKVLASMHAALLFLWKFLKNQTHFKNQPIFNW